MPRISKRTREAAIEACECRGNDWIGEPLIASMTDRPGGLALAAFDAIWDLTMDISDADQWLEAAALLRGDDEHAPWSPGDQVYLRSKES